MLQIGMRNHQNYQLEISMVTKIVFTEGRESKKRQ